jgi:hypothetical protein
MKKAIYYLMGLVMTFTLMSSSCEQTDSRRDKEELKVENTVKALTAQTELPVLTKSLERINIKKRLELFEDENKVSYIYLISFGKVMSFYTVKGKVSSGNKRLTANQTQVESNHWTQGNGSLVVDAPELDGTYGSSSPYIFFWTTDGTYVQWSSDYMLCDKPLKMTTQPELVREIK